MREVRTFTAPVTRAQGDGELRPIVGYAAIFNAEAEIYGYFVEKIAPGAFTAAIGRDDVRALFNHSDNLILGRTAAGTLRLAEDARGLRYEIDTPDTSYARDLVVSIDRGDVTQSSFAFRATREEWDETGTMPVRTILEAELYDVSPVTYPAYRESEVGLRAAAERTLAEARSGGLVTPPAPAFRSDLLKLRMRGELDLRARTPSRL